MTYNIKKGIHWYSTNKGIGDECSYRVELYIDDKWETEIYEDDIYNWIDVFKKLYEENGEGDIVVEEGWWNYEDINLEPIPITLEKNGFTITEIIGR